MNIVHLYPTASAIPEEYLHRFEAVQSSAVSDSMERTGGAPGIHAVGDCMSPLNGKSMVGTALTVRTRPGDNLAVHQALELARPGDVLVIDARGDVVNAILGELMTHYAASRGIVGIVVDGAIRDSKAISAGPIPVFCRGISHLGPYKTGPGAIHGDVSIGGTAVHDGDLILGDADGVVIVPAARVRAVLDLAETIMANEIGQRKAIDDGAWDRSWIAPAVQLVPMERNQPKT
jgi:regulator of RNase E activity RraA